MIHGHGGTFVLIQLNGGLAAHDVRQRLAREKNLIRRCKNIKGFSDRLIRISLKTIENNCLPAARINALSHGSQLEAAPLKKVQVACG